MKRADLCIKKSPSGRCSCAWEHWKGFANLPCAVITWERRLTILFSECSLIRRANIFLGPFFSFFFFFLMCTLKLTYKCPTNVTLEIKGDIRSCAVTLRKDSTHCLHPVLRHSLPYTESWGCGRSLPGPRKHVSGICLPPMPELLVFSRVIIWEEMSWIVLWIFQAFPCLLPWRAGKMRQQREALGVEQHLKRPWPSEGHAWCWWGACDMSRSRLRSCGGPLPQAASTVRASQNLCGGFRKVPSPGSRSLQQ